MILNKIIKILLIEDEEYDVKRVRRTLEPFKDRLVIKKVESDGQSALEYLAENKNLIDVVIMDFQIVGGITGESLIKAMKEIDSLLQIIVITKMTVNVTDYDFANALLEAGAMWYCTKYPGDIEDFIYQPTDFILSIMNAYHKKHILIKEKRSTAKLKSNVQEILENNRIIGESQSITKLKNQIEKAAAQEATVLVTGESGTGKELVARHIHYLSNRRYEKYVTINSGSLPHELIESELFGFEKGSFTGANYSKVGLFELANRGTIFLDEIAELPLSAQVKLLRVLQEGEIDKIGRTEKLNVDVRIIAATNKVLQEEIKERRFREDLFYRLNVVTIYVPPMRERTEDVPMLVEHFLEKFCREMSLAAPQIKDEAVLYMQKQPWPGNVRQLQNVLRRLLFLGVNVITRQDVEQALGGAQQTSSKNGNSFEWNRHEILPWRDMEKKIKSEYFNFVRENCSSDSEAARILGLAPPNYYRMCKELGLK
ncbi:MAG: sigma-54-dependent Fis family transcriptional regulator [Calditrichae bacterium]|nr:sigma-54-dependent Fis family transcriptional regulator [Calditrichota bacterium]MCB9058304.1 sigma-54-dependent Fis family transcriptional regulator [Calditrichia bacterium]